MSSKKDKSHYTKHLNVALHPVETKTRVPPTNQKAVNKVVPLQRINNVVPLQRINKVVPVSRRQTFSLKPFSVKKCNCGGGFF